MLGQTLLKRPLFGVSIGPSPPPLPALTRSSRKRSTSRSARSPRTHPIHPTHPQAMHHNARHAARRTPHPPPTPHCRPWSSPTLTGARAPCSACPSPPPSTSPSSPCAWRWDAAVNFVNWAAAVDFRKFRVGRLVLPTPVIAPPACQHCHQAHAPGGGLLLSACAAPGAPMQRQSTHPACLCTHHQGLGFSGGSHG